MKAKYYLQQFLNSLLIPHHIFLAGLIVSGLAWSVPDSWGYWKGYNTAEHFTLQSACLFVVWYVPIYYLTKLSFYFGKKSCFSFKINPATTTENPQLYFILTWIAQIGFLAACYQTFAILGFEGVISLALASSLNKVQDALYEGYSKGILSFRYVQVLTFGWALYHLNFGKKYRFDYINIILFLLNIALYGRRLQVILAILYFICLSNRDNKFAYRIPLRRFTIFATLGLGLIVLSTYLRSFTHYASGGYDNPLDATLANVVEYTASPFHIFIGLGNNLSLSLKQIDYYGYIDLTPGLMTNTAFSFMVMDYGWWAFPLIYLYVLFFGFLAGIGYANRENYLYNIYPIILYAYSEIWRLNLFDQGIFWTLFVCSAFVFMYGLVISKPVRVSF